MRKYGFKKGKGICKNGQGRQEPIPFIKNNKNAGVSANGAIIGGMVPIRSKVDGKHRKASSHQVKKIKINVQHTSKAKPHASQSSFYAYYVLTSDRKGKVVAKYVGYRTNIDQKDCVGAQGSCH
jgi:hypothetical protein